MHTPKYVFVHTQSLKSCSLKRCGFFCHHVMMHDWHVCVPYYMKNGIQLCYLRIKQVPILCTYLYYQVNFVLFFVALVEGRGLAKGEVGLASLDLKRPELMLSQVQSS